jgi:hypothetical protein
MGFLSPWFLAGALGVGLPVYLHLLRKHTSDPLPFASLMFFEPRTQSSIRHRRLQYLLLMAMRIALIALLALAFASPFVSFKGGAGAGKKLRLVVVDRSFSMRGGDRLERAKREAASAIDGFPRSDPAQVMVLDGRVELLTQATEDREQLRAAVRAIQPGDGRGAYAEISRTVKSIVQAARLPVEVHVFTDAQKTALPPGFADLQLPPDTTLKVTSVAGADEPNWCVESVNAPQTVYSSRKVKVRGTIAGAGTRAARRSATLMLNGRTIETRAVDVPANERAAVEFNGVEMPFGVNRGEVRIDGADTLAADDRFLFSVERAEPRRILFVNGARSGGAALYYRTALDATTDPAFTLDVRASGDASGATLGQYAFVVLSDSGAITPAFETELRKYVRAGGALLIAAGPATAGLDRLPVIGYKVDESKYYARSGERFQTVGAADPEHPSLKSAPRWEGVKFFQVARVEPGAAHIAARLSDETPVLADERVGEGRVLVFASTFDNLSNDFPLHASFVPFVQQTARYLAGLEDRPAHVPVGAFLELRRNAAAKAAAVDVIGPDGKRAMDLNEAARATTYQVSGEGFYEIRRGGGHNDTVAVNADRRESDLARIPPETLALWQRGGAGGGATAQGGGPAGGAEVERIPRNLWRYVMLAVLAVALVESVFSSRYLTFEREKGAAA